MTLNLRFGICLRGEAKARIMSRAFLLFGEEFNLGFRFGACGGVYRQNEILTNLQVNRLST